MSRRRAQRGAVLLIMLAILGLGSSWFLVSQLNAATGGIEAQRKKRNAEVLQRAKQALIGYVAAQAAKAGENNPGAFPCPEADAYVNSPDYEGTMSPNCTLPRVGRFPWRTIGTEKLVDASGEPLWYAVGQGWALQSGNTTINSNSSGQLTIDGVANAAVAVIIAPGPAFSVPAATGCAARGQVRPTGGTPNVLDYLECDNATSGDGSFVTTGPSASFNDQVTVITVADVMPAIEAAIADRMRREIIPALKTVYVPGAWGISTGSQPVLPHPAPFANPGSGAGTSSYQGSATVSAGLLPFNQTQNCTVSAADPRCTTSFLAFSKASADVQTSGSGYIRTQSTCAWQATTYVCTGEYFNPSIAVTVRIRVSNVAMGLRTFDATKVSFTAVDDAGAGWSQQNIPHAASVAMNADGSATVTIAGGTLPDISTAGWGTYANYSARIERAAFGDHALLSTTDATTGWFARNEWYRLTYYAVTPSNTAARLPLERSCASAGDCLALTTGAGASMNHALLLLAGRSVNGTSRPSSTLANYLESGNASGTYVQNAIRTSTSSAAAQRFNDRVMSFGSN